MIAFDSPTGLLLRAAAAPAQALPDLEQVDWSAFTTLAIEHRVAALAVSKFGDALPPHVTSTLRAASLRSAQNNLRLGQELNKVSVLLRQAQINAIPFKGAITAQLYEDLSHRPFGDIDLFLATEDVWRARGALTEHGFTPESDIPPQMEAVVLRWGCEYNLVSPDESYVVELHWRAAPKSYAIDWMFDSRTRLREVAVLGKDYSVLAREEDLLVLCMHAAKHVWNTLIWLADIGLAMQQPLDWNLFRELATKSGTRRICGTSFQLAKLIGYSVPAGAEQLLDATTESLAKLLAARIFGERHEYFTRNDHRLVLRSRERLSDRLAYLWWVGTAPDLYIGKSGFSGRIARLAKVVGGQTAS